MVPIHMLFVLAEDIITHSPPNLEKISRRRRRDLMTLQIPYPITLKKEERFQTKLECQF